MLSDRSRAAIDRTRAARAQIDAIIADHASATSAMDLPTLEEMVLAYAGRVLEAANGNKSAAAKILGLHRSRLRRIIDRAGADTAAGGPRPGAGRPARRKRATASAAETSHNATDEPPHIFTFAPSSGACLFCGLGEAAQVHV